MHTKIVRQVVVGALASGAIAVAGLALGAGSATAAPQGTWCPGQPLPSPAPNTFDWDMNVCHDYWFVPFGQGNVKIFSTYLNKPVDSNIWIGSEPVRTPPPPSPPPAPGSYCAVNPVGCHIFGPYGPGS